MLSEWLSNVDDRDVAGLQMILDTVSEWEQSGNLSTILEMNKGK